MKLILEFYTLSLGVLWDRAGLGVLNDACTYVRVI